MNLLAPLVFVIVGICILAWLVMCVRLFTILRTRHPQIYESLGKPSLFMNNSVQNNIATLRFLLGRHFAGLNDIPLKKLCSFMRILFFVNLALFVLLFVAIILQNKVRPN